MNVFELLSGKGLELDALKYLLKLFVGLHEDACKKREINETKGIPKQRGRS